MRRVVSSAQHQGVVAAFLVVMLVLMAWLVLVHASPWRLDTSTARRSIATVCWSLAAAAATGTSAAAVVLVLVLFLPVLVVRTPPLEWWQQQQLVWC
jgi:hypothetical protein